MDDDDRCPECHRDDIRVECSRYRFPPGGSPDQHDTSRRPVARTFWVKCENCGNTWVVTRKVKP